MERQVPSALRVVQRDWRRANLFEWTQRVQRDIRRQSGTLVVVAHSFGALAAVRAAFDEPDRIGGLLLVAPADPELFDISYAMPKTVAPFPVVLAASRTDPWIAFDAARGWAKAWGAQFVNLGDAGHVNVASGHGAWPEGLALHDRLIRLVEQENWPFDAPAAAGAVLSEQRRGLARWATAM
jgi:hypothetical protein